MSRPLEAEIKNAPNQNDIEKQKNYTVYFNEDSMSKIQVFTKSFL